MSGHSHNRFPNGPKEREANRYWVECRTFGKSEADKRALDRQVAREDEARKARESAAPNGGDAHA